MSVNKLFIGIWSILGIIIMVFLAQPVWRMNKANIIAAKILLADTQLSPKDINALGNSQRSSPKDLTTEALARISISGTQSLEQVLPLLQQALGKSSTDDKLSTSLRLEKQAEILASSGYKDQAQTGFKLLTLFQFPATEPYFRMGEFNYKNHFDLGFPYEQAYQAAIRAPVVTLRDNDLKSLAYSRLCENVLANSQDYELAEKFCLRAIDLAGQGPLFGHYAIKAHIMLGQALAGQGRFTEAADLLKSLIQGPPDRPYEAFAMYYLGYYVWEAQSRWKEALESYQQLILNADKDSRDSAKERVRLLCSEHPEWNCALP